VQQLLAVPRYSSQSLGRLRIVRRRATGRQRLVQRLRGEARLSRNLNR